MESPIGLTKKGENGKYGKNSKNPFFQEKIRNGSGNDKDFGQVAKYMLIHTMKENMIFGEESWGHAWG